ncbi:MAG: hypothetical protein ABGZ35_14800 [Planctomycetaceae bacterium]|jgi:hypothetical protein
MGSIIIHAGMPKAGSTSLQGWLATEAKSLLRRLDVAFLFAGTNRRRFQRHPTVKIDYCRHDQYVSTELAVQLRDPQFSDLPLVDQFMDQLSHWSEKHNTSVLTSEAFSVFFSVGDERFLSALDRLARAVPVRVAYYVRPQHSAIESAWRQWGFRDDASPSAFIQAYSENLHYLRTFKRTAELAPHVRLEVRPFDKDLLVRGNVAADFAHHFLDFSHSDSEAIEAPWGNRGLPLEVANLLRLAPRGMFWKNADDNHRLETVKRFLKQVEMEPSVRIRRSRQVLNEYCYLQFERDNQRLAQEFKWNTDSFIPRPAADESDWSRSLDPLDDDWRPDIGTNEANLFFATLQRAIRD